MKLNAKLFEDFILQLLHRLILLVQPIYTYWIDLFMKLNKTSSSPQTTVASIDDLLIQIFVRIPLKPLVRLKLVSKHWNFIISAQNFNLLRNQKQNPNPAVGLIFLIDDKLYCPSTTVPYLVSFKKTHRPLLRTLEFDSRWTTLSSCNGLLLCKREGYGVPNQIYFVCNPTTNKHFTLPRVDDPPILCSMSLAFDPSKSPHYKVVCVVTSGTYYGHPVYLEVYSSETGSWIKHSCEPFSGRHDFSRGEVYWNGAIHWISLEEEKALYFNPDNDQGLQVMPTPPRKPHDTYHHSYLGESCGHLHYIEDDKMMELNVYEMRTDYSEWFLKYRVDCPLIDNRIVSITFALIRGKRDEDSFLVLLSEKRIIRYNLVNKTCETICELDGVGPSFHISIYWTWLQPLQYIESLSHV